MEELKKEIAELKELVSKLLEIQLFKHEMQYGYLKNIDIKIDETKISKDIVSSIDSSAKMLGYKPIL